MHFNEFSQKGCIGRKPCEGGIGNIAYAIGVPVLCDEIVLCNRGDTMLWDA